MKKMPIHPRCARRAEKPVLAVLRRVDLRFLGTFLIGMVVLLLGGATVSFYVEVVPLMDPLKSVWLVIHVFVASLATALFAIACGISITQLLQARRERRTRASSDTARADGLGFLRTLPAADVLESLAYRFAIVGFVFWTFTLIAGAIWANDSWGRYCRRRVNTDPVASGNLDPLRALLEGDQLGRLGRDSSIASGGERADQGHRATARDRAKHGPRGARV